MLWGWTSAFVFGCGTSDVFQCEANDQCVLGEVMGACQDNGFCGFPDDSCPSGTRYGEQAPPGLSRVCIESDESTAATSTGTTNSSTPEVTTGITTTGSSTTAQPDGDETTVGASDTDPSESDGSSSSGNNPSSATGTTGAERRCVSLIDDFEDAAIDRDLWSITDPSEVRESDGRLRLLCTEISSGTAGVTASGLEMRDGEILVHIAKPPAHVDIPFQIRLADPLNGSVAEVTLDSSHVLTVSAEDSVQMVSLAPTPERWIRISVTVGGLFAETSQDGANFDDVPLGRLGLSFSGESVDVSLLRLAYSVDAEEGSDDRPPIEIESFEHCGVVD